MSFRRAHRETPGFDGKIGLAPPVRDLANKVFSSGGEADVLQGPNRRPRLFKGAAKFISRCYCLARARGEAEP